MVAPGQAAVAFGAVWHRRNRPREHEFDYRVNQIWIDPDRPEDLFDRHPLWSCRRASPIRFHRRDYFDGGSRPIGPAIRAEVADALGAEPTGPIRMLTQPRTWGWLFNPITVYLVWDGGPAQREVGQPVGAVLEVTNTPWKERHTYPMALEPDGGDRLVARFDKRLHVSPFLGEDYVYELAVGTDDDPGNFEMAIDVYNPEPGPAVTEDKRGVNDHKSGKTEEQRAVVETRLRLELAAPTTRSMTSALYRNPMPTHRVSVGIHTQAARLLAKRVPFVPHPKSRTRNRPASWGESNQEKET